MHLGKDPSAKTEAAEVLQQLLKNEVQTLIEATAKSGGQITAEQMEPVGRLQKLIEIQRSLAPPRRRRWPAVATFVVTLFLASLLFFNRVRSADIEMDAQVSEVSFRLARPQTLWKAMDVAVIGVSGVRDVELPREVSQADGNPSGSGFQVETDPDKKPAGSISLAALPLPAGTHVRLQKTNIPRQYRVSLHGEGIEFRAAVRGPVTVALPGVPHAKIDFTVPQGITSRTGAEEAEIDLTFARAGKIDFSSEVPVKELSLVRVEQSSDTAQTIARHASNILSGTIFFESLGAERKLRTAEGIRFDSSNGELRTLELNENGIAVKFHGLVSGMTSGFEENRRSIMPSRLEWLRAQQGLPLLWGGALYAFTMLVAALRWWGINL